MVQILLNSISTKSKFRFARVFGPFVRFTLSLILTNGEITMNVNESRIKTRRREKNEKAGGKIIKGILSEEKNKDRKKQIKRKIKNEIRKMKAKRKMKDKKE